MERRAALGEVKLASNRKEWAISPDGKVLVNTSETTNMAHFIDTRERKIIANVVGGFSPSFRGVSKVTRSELWVSSEIGGTVSHH
jgi:hypothetical protein